jgi:two-component system, sensor histidine kinase and response regulator
MGGEIGVDGRPGVGSTFWFTLPLREVAGSPPSKLDGPKFTPRTLIVDDNETNRVVLEELLRRWGMQSVSVDNAEAALFEVERAESERQPFGLVLSDLNMPDTDGASLARALATGVGADGPALRPRFILLTSTDADAIGGLGDYIDGMLQKPIRAHELVRTMNGVLASSITALARPVTMEPKRVSARPILVVEDNPVNQEVMRESLTQLGYRCVIVDNGQLALDELERNQYPLIFMDCQMPVLDGYGATREIRRREAGGSRIPIIAVTAHAYESERSKVLDAGMDDYMAKPIKQAFLLEALQRWWPDGAHAGPQSDDEPRSRQVSITPGDAEDTRPVDAVLRAFMRVAPEQIADIEHAVSASDAALLAAAAHKLKGGCLALGAATMASLCAQLERNPKDRAALCAQLNVEFQRVAARWGGKAEPARAEFHP